MFGLPKLQNRGQQSSTRASRRISDGEEGEAEIAVLDALQVAARRSSPHKASTRAGIARAISIIEAATLGLCHITELVDEAEALCCSGLATEDTAKRALLGERYAEVLAEVRAVAEATGHGGVHLINNSGNTFEVNLCPSVEFKMKLPHINLSPGPKGLALPKVTRAFASTQGLEHLKAHLTLVQNRLEHSARIFCEHGGELARHLALVLEHAIPNQQELRGVPQAPETRWASET